ncbi:hypothetical protein M514_08059 [Trichuris suis]|uniref:Collagen triple helix repeat protein n=1 Tax=Trichuris suis TaxID=68888 RepID=A0A085NUT5_9BILA|nr:hypothetical protein M513_08059 [Trichuris suis]KFD73231.1 hypothetical protein M514_08059 [Trichuris suis]
MCSRRRGFYIRRRDMITMEKGQRKQRRCVRVKDVDFASSFNGSTDCAAIISRSKCWATVMPYMYSEKYDKNVCRIAISCLNYVLVVEGRGQTLTDARLNAAKQIFRELIKSGILHLRCVEIKVLLAFDGRSHFGGLHQSVLLRAAALVRCGQAQYWASFPGPPGGPCGPLTPGVPTVPGGPGGPGGPLSPAGPFFPGLPGFPGVPCCPGAPGGPCGPLSPLLPITPSGPLSPCSPCGPGSPGGPGGPIGPAGPGRPGFPSGPIGPGGPFGPCNCAQSIAGIFSALPRVVYLRSAHASLAWYSLFSGHAYAAGFGWSHFYFWYYSWFASFSFGASFSWVASLSWSTRRAGWTSWARVLIVTFAEASVHLSCLSGFERIVVQLNRFDHCFFA